MVITSARLHHLGDFLKEKGNWIGIGIALPAQPQLYLVSARLPTRLDSFGHPLHNVGGRSLYDLEVNKPWPTTYSTLPLFSSSL